MKVDKLYFVGACIALAGICSTKMNKDNQQPNRETINQRMECPIKYRQVLEKDAFIVKNTKIKDTLIASKDSLKKCKLLGRK